MATELRARPVDTAPLSGVPTEWLIRELRQRRIDFELAVVKTSDLTTELQRRGFLVVGVDRDIQLDGFELVVSQGLVRWGEHEKRIGGRSLELVRALAVAWPSGLKYRSLAMAIWGGVSEDDIQSARVVVGEAKVRYPGLIEANKSGHWVVLRLALRERESDGAVA